MSQHQQHPFLAADGSSDTLPPLVMRWWPETYAGVKQVCVSERPDFILSDLLADASVDVARELDIPLAMSYPQMPIRMYSIFVQRSTTFASLSGCIPRQMSRTCFSSGRGGLGLQRLPLWLLS